MSPVESVYFSQLRQEFKNDPYRDRFLAELEDHAEDLAEAEKIPEKSLTAHFMEKHFGDPKEVKKTFVQITRPWQKWLEAAEAIGYGFFPLWVSYFLLAFWGVEQVNLQVLLLPTVLVFFTSFLIYRWVQQRILFKREMLSVTAWKSLIFLPLLIFIFVLILRFFASQEKTVFAYLLFHIASLFGGLISLFKPSSFSKPKTSTSPEARMNFAAMGFAFYFLAFSLSRLWDPSFSSGLFQIIFAPILFPETLFYTLFFHMTFWWPYAWVGLMLVPVLLLVALAFRGKGRPWVATSIAFYLIGILFAPSYVVWTPQFKVPVENLSETLESRQFGPFYNIIRYLNEDIAPSFSYHANFTDHDLILEQNSGERVSTWKVPMNEIKNLKEGLSYSFKTKNREFIFYPLSQIIPEDLSCIPSAVDQKTGSRMGKKLEFFQLNVVCESILWKGKVIYQSKNNGLQAETVSISADENWLLFNTSSAIYLLDLRGLNGGEE